MSSTKAQPKRRYGTALEAALLDAAWEELKEFGYDQLSFDSVAKRAGTSKPVLYRRWSSRLELVHATLRAHRPLLTGHLPNTGSLRSDVITLLERIAAGIDELRLAIGWGMMMDVMGDQNQRNYVREEILKSNVDAMRVILQRAVARGEIKTADILERIMTLPLDLGRHEMIVSGQAASKATIRQIVDDVFLPLVVIPETGSHPC
jgi:AcrR family transcriptional regulator